MKPKMEDVFLRKILWKDGNWKQKPEFSLLHSEGDLKITDIPGNLSFLECIIEILTTTSKNYYNEWNELMYVSALQTLKSYKHLRWYYISQSCLVASTKDDIPHPSSPDTKSVAKLLSKPISF